MDYSFLLSALMNIGLACIWAWYFFLVMQPRWKIRMMPAIVAAGLFAGSLFAYLIPIPQYLLRTSIGTATYCLVVLLCFKESFFRKILYFGLAMVVLVVSEMGFAALSQGRATTFTWVGYLSFMQQIVIYFLYLVLNAFLLWVVAWLTKKQLRRMENRDIQLFAFLPLSQYILMIQIFYYERDVSFIAKSNVYAICIALFFIVDALFFRALQKRAQRAAFSAQNNELQKQLAMQYTYYEEFLAHYHAMRKLRHDLANHMHTLHILLHNSQIPEAQAYGDELVSRYAPALSSKEAAATAPDAQTT